MSLLIFGSTGQVATELRARAPGARFLSRAEADLEDPRACAAAIAASGAEAVINAAAYTAVDRAEEEEDLATTINAAAPAAMAWACAKKGIPFVHLSTDYVFDGTGDAPRETDAATGPLGAYGRSKLLGEEAVREAGGAFVILRTSWVFSAHGSNFVKTMLRLGAERAQMKIVADQVGGPTAAGDIAGACLKIAAHLQDTPEHRGTFHFAGAPDVSWADFAREIFRQAGLSTAVEDIPSSAYPTPAKRPANSRLDCTGTEVVFDLPRPDWRQSLARVLSDLEAVKA